MCCMGAREGRAGARWRGLTGDCQIFMERRSDREVDLWAKLFWRLPCDDDSDSDKEDFHVPTAAEMAAGSPSLLATADSAVVTTNTTTTIKTTTTTGAQDDSDDNGSPPRFTLEQLAAARKAIAAVCPAAAVMLASAEGWPYNAAGPLPGDARHAAAAAAERESGGGARFWRAATEAAGLGPPPVGAPSAVRLLDLAAAYQREKDYEGETPRYERQLTLEGRIERAWLDGWDVVRLFGPAAAIMLRARFEYFPMTGTSIGITWEYKGEVFEVTSVNPIGPCQDVLHAGDLLVAVEGETLETAWGLEELLRGPPNSLCRLAYVSGRVPMDEARVEDVLEVQVRREVFHPSMLDKLFERCRRWDRIS